jgi:phosphate transport system permease protein
VSAHGAAHPVIGSQPRRDRVQGRLFQLAMFSSLAIGIVSLVTLLVQVFAKGSSRLNGDLVNNFPSSNPDLAGVQSAMFGTLWVIGVVAATCIPIGVGAAVYLEEYANNERWWNRLIELNIQNLAAVPSIVYGIVGLAFLVRGFADLGQVVLAGGLTLSLLVLPIVIISSREAIRAVPGSIRQGAMALGATKWQTIRRQVLPAAIPGMATGTILALSRAIGEAAPLVLLGGLTFITFNPDGLDSQFTVLPIQIFNWISRPQEEFKVVAAAAIVLLLMILIAMNAFAIYLRNRYQRKW